MGGRHAPVEASDLKKDAPQFLHDMCPCGRRAAPAMSHAELAAEAKEQRSVERLPNSGWPSTTDWAGPHLQSGSSSWPRKRESLP